MKPIHTLATGLILSACSYVPIDTLRQLSQLDPMTADPASIAVRFHLPQGLDMPEGSAVLTLDTKNTAGAELNEVYVLRRASHAGDVVFRVAPNDLERLRAQQAAVKTWGEEESDGTLRVGIEDLCTIGAGPPPDARLSTAISLDAGDTFLPLVTDISLSEVLEQGEFSELAPC